jgi:hypothetical protein
MLVEQTAAPADHVNVSTRFPTRARLGLLVTAAVLSLCLVSTASGQARRSGASVMPTTKAAHTIVANLWEQREAALSLLDTTLLTPYESGSALQLDAAYLKFPTCTCTTKRTPHPSDKILVAIPKAATEPVFFAQVHTTDALTHKDPWYIVAVKRDDTGHWKLAFVTVGGDAATPPLTELGTTDAATPKITKAVRSRLTTVAAYGVGLALKPGVAIDHSRSDATLHSRAKVRPGSDGIFGLALPGGKVLSCFTVHDLATFSMKGVLARGNAWARWGTLIAQGSYKSITADYATPQCLTGSGVGSVPGAGRMAGDETVISVTGVRSS